uniref:Guanine deaminase n=1 Tax=Mucochytrium quahogii TaxID=96639 RepID=A0A7S2WD95_9STRA|mmetsp:Transcript_9502/g.15569  ORF Transcript_9502/g.15569 Transcript_9502/m.15569 type:complete len:446 (+) Transcript_9502:34-1371(+)
MSVFHGRVAHFTRCPFTESKNEQERQAFEILDDIVVKVEGNVIAAVVPAKSPQGKQLVQDQGLTQYRLTETQILIPGFIDTHLHAPQYSYTGTATDLPLMQWLSEYTFPAESRLAKDPYEEAKGLFNRVVDRTLKCGTTTGVYFATKDLEVTKVLADVCKEKQQRAFIGKVCMDRHSPEFYVETTQDALDDTETLIQYVKQLDSIVYPIITPRFIPTCSTELLKGLADIADKYDCHIQSHISESIDEVQFTASLHPLDGSDTNIFQRAGLLRPKAIYAHAVHLSEDDVRILAKHRAAISHCPLSNFYFAQGYFPVAKFMRMGLQVGLGTDVAGGYSPSMFNAQRMAVVASLAGSFQSANQLDHMITYKDAFYLATLGGALALGLGNQLGTINPGFKFDAVVLDAAQGDNIDLFPRDTPEDIFQKLCTLGDDRNVKMVFVNGKKVI